MTTPVYERFRDWLADAGLTAGYTVQLLQWIDVGATVKYLVIFPDGGLPMTQGLGQEHYLILHVVAAKDARAAAMAQAMSIQQYALDNPDDHCLGYIQNMSTTPKPIYTTDNRLVIPLQFRIANGE